MAPLAFVLAVTLMKEAYDDFKRHLRDKARLNTPGDIRVAVPYYKPSRNQTDRVPDYYLHETTQWIKFPHSLEGLSDDEIRSHRPGLAAILADD